MLLLPSRQGPQESLMLFVFRAGLPKRQGFTALNSVFCLVRNLTLNKFCRHFIKARWRWLALENHGLLRPSIILNSSRFDTIIYISETKLLLDAPLLKGFHHSRVASTPSEHQIELAFPRAFTEAGGVCQASVAPGQPQISGAPKRKLGQRAPSSLSGYALGAWQL